MRIESIHTAALRAHSPSKAYLTKLSKKDNRPDFFVLVKDKWKIDVDDDSWKTYLFKRATGEAKGTLPQQTGSDDDTIVTSKPTGKPKGDTSGFTTISQPAPTGDVEADLRARKLYEEIREKEIKNEILYTKMQKESGNLFDRQLVEYLYTSFMDKACVDFLRAAKKNEAIIDNLVKEGKTRDIIRLIEREATAAIHDVKSVQAATLETWEDEEGLANV